MLLVYLYCLGAHRQRWMPFWPPYLVASERFVENKMICRIKLISLFIIDLCKTLPKSPWPTPVDGCFASDWGDSLNWRRRGGQTEHHGDDVCRGSCVVVWLIARTIPTVGNLGGGVFCSHLNPYSGKAVKLTSKCWKTFSIVIESWYFPFASFV